MTVQLHQERRCFSLLHTFNTGAVQKCRFCGHAWQRVVSKFLTAECASQIEIGRPEKGVWWGCHRWGHLDAGFVVLRVVKRTLETGPTVVDQPWQRQRRPKPATSQQVNCAHIRNLKTGGYGHSQRTWLPKIMCTRWVLYMLSGKQKITQNSICTELLQSYRKDGDAYLSRIITGDETLVHHYDQLMKVQSVEWYHELSPCKIQFKAQTSAGTAMASIIWDSEESLLVEFLKRHSTVNLERYTVCRH